MALKYKRFYYDIDNLSNDASIFVDEVLVLKKVTTFTDDGSISPSELFSGETRVFKVNSVMEFKNKTDRKIPDPLNWIAGRLSAEEILKFNESMTYLPLDYRLISVTELKLNSLRKVVGDKDFVDEADALPYAMPIMVRCYDGVDFQYKDTNGEHPTRYFGKFFIINDSGYILSAAYIKESEAPNPFNLYALAATRSFAMFRRYIRDVNVCELSDIKFDDMLAICKNDAFSYHHTIMLDGIGYDKTYGFLISNIEKVDPAELDGHFSYRIKGRFIDDDTSSLENSFDFKSNISHGLDIGSAMNLKIDRSKSLVTLELGDFDDVKRVYADDFELASMCSIHLLEGLFYVKLIEWCNGKQREQPIVWPVYTVYRQFMQFDRIRRKAIDDYIGNLSDEELANIGPDDKLFCVE